MTGPALRGKMDSLPRDRQCLDRRFPEGRSREEVLVLTRRFLRGLTARVRGAERLPDTSPPLERVFREPDSLLAVTRTRQEANDSSPMAAKRKAPRAKRDRTSANPPKPPRAAVGLRKRPRKSHMHPA